MSLFSFRAKAPGRGRFLVARYDRRGEYEDRVAFFATEREAQAYAYAVTLHTRRKAVVFELKRRGLARGGVLAA